MEYFDFLNKKTEQTRQAQTNQSATNGNERSDVDNTQESLFGDSSSTTQNTGSSLFSLETPAQLENIDYDNIISQNQLDDSNPLAATLSSFFSTDAVKANADTNGDGTISAQEAKDYLTQIAAQDGDASTLSSEDLNAAFNAQQTMDASTTQMTTSAFPSFDFFMNNLFNINPNFDIQLPFSFPTFDGSYPDAGNTTSASGSAASSVDTTPADPLDSMSLEELEAEKSTREATVKEKQADINAVNNGTNEKVKEATDEKQQAEEAYKEAVKNDENISKKTNKDFQKNIEKLDENQAKLDDNAVKINDKEVEISNQEEAIKTLTAESESLTSYVDKFNNQLAKLKEDLSKVGEPTGKPEDADKDAKIKAKKQELNNKISEKNNEIKEKKDEITEKEKELKKANEKLEKLKKELEKLNEEKTKLEEKKTELNNEKETIETQIKENCIDETKAKMDAYNKAVKKVEDVKAQELQTAQTALKEAQEAVQVINTKINKVKNKKVSAQDINMDNIPAQYRDQIVVKTLADGTEVLTFKYTNTKGLNPEMQEKIDVFNEVAAEMGYTFVMSDGYRSIEESNRARARKGNLVAPGGKSPHNYGAAFDCGVYKNGGQQLSRAEWTEFTREVQRRSDNIKWGGDFKSKSCEVWHFELSDWKKYRA